MVGVPVLFVVWVGACPPFTCVMAVGVGVSWWCVFQWWVAVVWASSCVPGVLACVVSGACSGVVWLVSGVGVSVCVSWFRMLTCLASFFFLGFVLVLFVWLITVWWFVAVVVWFLLGCGVGLAQWGYWVVVSCLFGVRSCARLCLLKGCWAKVSVGVCGCLGEGCVVRGGVVPVWLGGAVAGGGVGVSFDVGSRVFVLSGVSVPESGSGASVSSPAVSGSASASGSVVPVSPGAGVAAPEFGSESAPVGSVSSLASLSGSTPASVSVSSCGPVVPECGGVVVCAPCAVRVFGDSWCSLVLRRWARAAGVDWVRVSGLLSSSVNCVPGSGSLSAGSAPVASAPVSGGSVSASVSSRAGRVGVGFGARVRDWGARVGVGGGVVSGGGVVLGWWARARGRVSALVSGVGVWGLVGLCGVCALVLVSVLVLVG